MNAVRAYQEAVVSYFVRQLDSMAEGIEDDICDYRAIKQFWQVKLGFEEADYQAVQEESDRIMQELESGKVQGRLGLHPRGKFSVSSCWDSNFTCPISGLEAICGSFGF